MYILKICLETLGVVVLLITLMPMIRSDYWTFRVFEYPRIQKLTLNVILVSIFGYYFLETSFDHLLFGALLLNACYLIYQIFPFTIFANTVIKRAERSDPKNQVRIVSSNVFQDNTDVAGCLHMLEKYDPDILLLLETNEFWKQGTEVLKEKYPYSMLIPQENTYGMLFYSRYKLRDTEKRFLVEKDIPSIKTWVELPSGESIRLYCVHPTPPVPGENVRSTERDKELLLIGKEAKEADEPTIVIGDLNDVAWSHTTHLFTKISGLLDPRVGRGFFNTFHAKMFLLRFPLDHVFCSTDFKLIKLIRGINFNSDHFPIVITLQYEPAAHLEQEEPEADAEEQAEADEKISKDTND
ncbi:endonuclease/exonuclease/phosphatase family protein [Dyadobacter tibetensis]|uniref:endonuclease/exonuclease/phosphatase family protein n=1 Tax=Dyadobacter tibetensis TaxID=1211851 RepID=UPI00047177BA|nr:endonuclease/exonuclease/phosphatase family protein [Dyadobacter tibetensis]